MNPRTTLIAFSAAMTLLAGTSAEAQFRRFGRQPSPAPSESDPNPVHEKTKMEAQSAYQRGEFQRTIDLTSSVLRANPRDDVAYYLRGSARVELGLKQSNSGLVREGIADAREAIRFKGATNSIYYIPYFYGMTSLSALEKRDEHAEVVVKYATQASDRAGIKPEDKAHLLFQRGKAQVALGNLDEAIADFASAVRLLPDQVSFRLDLADASARAGRNDEAADAYRLAIERFPDEPVVYNNRGMFRQTQGETAGAIGDFTQALELDPRFHFALTNRGLALLRSGDASAAENDLTASLRLNADQPRAYGLRASARLAQGRVDEGITDHREAVRRDSKNPIARADLGYALYFAGDYAGSLQAFDQAVQLDPGLRYLDPWRYLAMERSGQADAAESRFGETIQADAAKRDWIDHLLAYLTGQIDDETLIQSVHDRPGVKTAQLCEAHFFIAEQHSMAGEADAATEHFKSAIETGAQQLATYRGANLALKKVSTASGED